MGKGEIEADRSGSVVLIMEDRSLLFEGVVRKCLGYFRSFLFHCIQWDCGNLLHSQIQVLMSWFRK